MKIMITASAIILSFFLSLIPLPASDTLSLSDAQKLLKEIDDASNYGKQVFASEFTIVQENSGQEKIARKMLLFRNDAENTFFLLATRDQGYHDLQVALLKSGDKLVGLSKRYYGNTEIIENQTAIKCSVDHSSGPLETMNLDLNGISLESQGSTIFKLDYSELLMTHYDRDFKAISVTDGKLGVYDVYFVNALEQDMSGGTRMATFAIDQKTHHLLKLDQRNAAGEIVKSTMIPKYSTVNGYSIPFNKYVINPKTKDKMQIVQNGETRFIETSQFSFRINDLKDWFERIFS